VSFSPNTFAQAGASVFTGSDANPTAATMTRKITSCGRLRKRSMLART
jgi:hypothetical protein